MGRGRTSSSVSVEQTTRTTLNLGSALSFAWHTEENIMNNGARTHAVAAVFILLFHKIPYIARRGLPLELGEND
jgi:hypothetical protein